MSYWKKELDEMTISLSPISDCLSITHDVIVIDRSQTINQINEKIFFSSVIYSSIF